MIIGRRAAINSHPRPKTATFGKTAVGASAGELTGERKRVWHYSLPVEGAVSKVSIHINPGVTAGSIKFKALLYADSSGVPGTLLATGEEVVFVNTTPEGWYDLKFTSPITLAPGTYWIGFIPGPGEKIIGYKYDVVAGSRAYNVNSYAAGPTNPFGAATIDSEQWSVYATYTPISVTAVPSNTALPTISGTAQEGNVLTLTSGTWNNSPTSITHQWLRCDSAGANPVAIAGQTGTTYAVTGTDVGKTIRVEEKASNGIGAGTPVNSAATAVVVKPAVPVNTSLPTITGGVEEGQTLTGNNGTWTNNPSSITHQWLRCDSAGANAVAIAGATNQTYVLTSTDVGKTIRFQETTANAGGTSSPATSAQTAVIKVVSATTSFSPAVIPLSEPEITNSGRGLYDWEEEFSMTPPGWPMKDLYLRDSLTWAGELETTKGVYPFINNGCSIDTWLAKATSKGGRLRFRIMTWMVGGSGRQPSYIETEKQGSSSANPVWNSNSFLEAWDNLWIQLGKKYGNNPGIGWVDIGGYGAWGEWHSDGMPMVHLSTANGVRMTKAVVNAFPKAHVVLGSSAAIFNETSAGQPPLMPEILKQCKTVGFHFDNLGELAPADGNNIVYMRPGGANGKTAAENPEGWERWKTAPLIGEWWNQSSATVAKAQNTINELHTSTIGSGNNPAQVWKNEPTLYPEVIKKTGFRLILKKVDITPFSSSSTATIKSTWENINVAPVYDPWEVKWQLLNGTTVVWSANSTIDLRTILPTEGTPKVFNDTPTITAAKGTYTLAILINDPNAYLAPLALANTGRTANGTYPLGTVTVA